MFYGTLVVNLSFEQFQKTSLYTIYAVPLSFSTKDLIKWLKANDKVPKAKTLHWIDSPTNAIEKKAPREFAIKYILSQVFWQYRNLNYGGNRILSVVSGWKSDLSLEIMRSANIHGMALKTSVKEYNLPYSACNSFS